MTPEQEAAVDAVLITTTELNAARARADELLDRRARELRALVESGVAQARIPALTGLSAGTVKADLRRFPRTP